MHSVPKSIDKTAYIKQAHSGPEINAWEMRGSSQIVSALITDKSKANVLCDVIVAAEHKYNKEAFFVAESKSANGFRVVVDLDKINTLPDIRSIKIAKYLNKMISPSVKSEDGNHSFKPLWEAAATYGVLVLAPSNYVFYDVSPPIICGHDVFNALTHHEIEAKEDVSGLTAELIKDLKGGIQEVSHKTCTECIIRDEKLLDKLYKLALLDEETLTKALTESNTSTKTNSNAK